MYVDFSDYSLQRLLTDFKKCYKGVNIEQLFFIWVIIRYETDSKKILISSVSIGLIGLLCMQLFFLIQSIRPRNELFELNVRDGEEAYRKFLNGNFDLCLIDTRHSKKELT